MASTRPVPGAEDALGTMTAAAREHHSDLWAELTLLESDLIASVTDGGDFGTSRAAFVQFLREEVSDHLQAEHDLLHASAREVGEEALVQTLELDHQALLALIDLLDRADTGLEAALAARSLVMLFALRMEKEESVLLPRLRRAGVDVDALLQGHVAITGGHGEGSGQ